MLVDALSPLIIADTHAARALFVQVFIASVITVVIIIDRYLIIKKRQQRDESISPLQKKIHYINWVVCGSGVLLVMFAEQNLPGTHMIFGFFIVLFGFCLYVFGLFSYPWFRWAGLIQLVLGICALFLLKFTAMQIYAACSFVIGGALIHFFNKNNLNTQQLIFRSLSWVAAVWFSTSLIFYCHYKLYIDSDNLPSIPLAQYGASQAASSDPIAVSIPKGTEIPFEYLFEFNLFSKSISAQWHMQLAQSVDIIMQNGVPTGVYRIGNHNWRRRRESLQVTKFSQKLTIDPVDGPTIQREVQIHSNRNYPGLNL